MLQSLLISLVVLSSFAIQGKAQAAGKHPCAQIEKDCRDKGYIVGEAAEGKGFWWDCLCPLVAPGFPEPKKNALTPPADGDLATECRALPNGQKIISKCNELMAKKNAKAAAKTTP